MQKQFLCLANARHNGGRILVVSPLDDSNNQNLEFPFEPISIMFADNSSNNIPTGFVADVLPLDIIQVKLCNDEKRGSKLVIDPWSLQLPARMRTSRFHQHFAPRLERKIAANLGSGQDSNCRIQLLKVQACQIKPLKAEKQASPPILEYVLSGMVTSAPTTDAELFDAYFANESPLEGPKDSYIVIQQSGEPSQLAPVVLGVIG